MKSQDGDSGCSHTFSMEVKLGLRRTKKGSKIQAPENLTVMSVKITILIKSGKL
jgi:hypothetical protein